MMRMTAMLLAMVFLVASTSADDTPRVVREEIEWLDVWVPGNTIHDRPRVLLVGDSITKGYYQSVEDRLRNKAIVCRLATSKSLGDPALLDEVRLVLGQAKFDVVHFNNGLHGWSYTEAEYAGALPDALAAIRKAAPDAKVIIATSTAMRVGGKLSQFEARNGRVKLRNQSLSEFAAKEKLPLNDLFAAVAERPELYSNDGVHMNANGNRALGEQVASHILKTLSE